MSDQGNEAERPTNPFAAPPGGTPAPDAGPAAAGPTETTTAETPPAAYAAPASRVGTGRLVAIGAVVAVVAVAASVAGAVLGHELWKNTRISVATATGGNGSAGNGFFPGSSGAGSFPSIGNLPGNGNFPSFGGSSGSFGGSSSSSGGSTSNTSGGPSNVSAIAGKVSPGLVDINAKYSYQSASGAGTGIVISSNGEVLTNNHVIDGATSIFATDIGNGKTYTATVVGYDPSHDLAVLQLKGASGLKTATFADSSALKVGDAVVGIGNAGGVGGKPSSAGGSITALNQSITASDDFGGDREQLSGLIGIDANIQPGDSGGPLVNAQGQVVGIDTAGSASGFGFQTSDGNAYAIPSNQAKATALSILKRQSSSTVHIGATAFLGISVEPSNGGGFGFGDSGSSSTAGVQVGSVLNGLPAQKAGLAAGDTITSLGGHSISSSSALSGLMLVHHPGDKVDLNWVDTSGGSHSASVQLASGPPA
jgi:S1-C subfamily serine protease